MLKNESKLKKAGGEYMENSARVGLRRVVEGSKNTGAVMGGIGPGTTFQGTGIGGDGTWDGR
jgi:hypothetical protein